MISLSKMNQHIIVINADQIEVIEQTPDTVITLINGHKYIVTESAEEVINRVVAYKKRIYNLKE
jgi:flagellar protein FlbD